MTPRYCRVPGCDHDPDNLTCGPYLPPLREGELQRYAGLIPDGSGLSIEERRVPLPATRRGWFGSRVDDLRAAVRLNKALDRAIEETRRNRAVDATFENETRPQ